jgi:hypothetical protein
VTWELIEQQHQGESALAAIRPLIEFTRDGARYGFPELVTDGLIERRTPTARASNQIVLIARFVSKPEL